MQLGGFSATNFRDLSKGVTAPQKDRDLLRAYLQRRPAVKRREGPGGFFDNHREVSDQWTCSPRLRKTPSGPLW